MREDAFQVPGSLRLATAWAWRVLVLMAFGWVLIQLIAYFNAIMIPLSVSLLLVALVKPLTDLLSAPIRGRRVIGRSLASLITVLFTLVVVIGLLTLTGQQLATGLPSLTDQTALGLVELRERLAHAPLNLTNGQINRAVDQLTTALRANTGQVVSGALAATTTLVHLLAGLALTMFSAFFFLADGEGIWASFTRLVPRAARARMDGAGRAAWSTITSFTRATVIVALTDAIGIAVVARLLGVPLTVPLGILVFIFAFVPIIGALISGSVAVLVALVAQGPLAALLMLLGVLVVQQTESHLLQPFLLGRAVRVHPLAVLLAIGTGVLAGGIVGALFAVPVVAAANAVIDFLWTTRELDEQFDEVEPAPCPGPAQTKP